MENRREQLQSVEEEAEQKYAELRDLPSVKEAFLLIDEGLRKKYVKAAEQFPDVLPYHGKPHTEDVLHEAILFAMSEGVNDPRELELLAVAAAFHDAGFINNYDENEKFGAEFAEKYMSEADTYSVNDINRVKKIILSTQVKFDPEFKQLIQDENDPLCRIMADADVSNLGRTDCAEKSEKVFQELLVIGKIPADNPKTRSKFNESRKKMLRTHKWQTVSAKNLRGEQEQLNLQEMEGQLVSF